MKNIFFIGILIFLISSCSSKNVEVQIDNPSDSAITLSIDTGKPITIGPNTLFSFGQLATGNHQIIINGDSLSFLIHARLDSVILNPLQEQYVKVGEMYGDEISIKFASKTQVKNEIMLDSILYKGFYTLVEDICIDRKSFDYDLVTPFPDQIQVMVRKGSGLSGVTYKTKLFRKGEFMTTYIPEFLKGMFEEHDHEEEEVVTAEEN
ncbi:MAG: hypothetical protein E6767_00830 [Dysgonomonas sp.]|nr:hypothetical protein [Dysgonomonas sp.]